MSNLHTARPTRIAALTVSLMALMGSAPLAGATDWAGQARAMAMAMLESDRSPAATQKDDLPAIQVRGLGMASRDAEVSRVKTVGGTWSLAADSTSRDTAVRNQATGATLAGERYVEMSYAPDGSLAGASLTTGYRSAASQGFGDPAYRAWYGRVAQSYAVARNTQAGVALDVERPIVRGVPGYAGATLFVSHDLTPDVTAGAYVGRTRAFDGYNSSTAGLTISIAF